MFKTKDFLKCKFTERTADVKVPDLKSFFDEGDKPVWTVRGLTGKELGFAREAAGKNKSIIAIIEMLKSAKVEEKTEAMEAVMEMGGKGKTPEAVAMRIEHLMAASVAPKCSMDLALKLCDKYPVVFDQLALKILELTGVGQEPGKR